MKTESRIALFPLLFAICKLLLHFFVNAKGGYGYFRDELYYIACSDHLAAGYVDHPPLSIFILSFSRLLFGDSIFAIRLLPAICGAATVYLAGIIAREIGGRKTAQSLASLGVFFAPIFLGLNSIYSMNSFDELFWTLTVYLLVKLINTGDPKYWIYTGYVLGLGLLNKIGILWLGAGIGAGLLFTPERKWLTTKYPYIAGAMALLIFSPFIIWNMTHDFAHLEFIRNATSQKYAGLTRLGFLKEMFRQQNPASVILWASGIFFLFFSSTGKTYRFLGFIFLTTFLILIINEHTKAEYISSAFPLLFAGGGVAFEQYLTQPAWTWVKRVYAFLIMLLGIVIIPLVTPILPVESYISYAETLKIKPSSSEEKKLDKLPQFYADMFGWENMEKTVARVFYSLSEEEKQQCLIFAQDYGQASAIHFFGKADHLPPVSSGHNNYWIWGASGKKGEVVIIIGGNAENHLKLFETVRQEGLIVSPYAIPYETNLPVFVCRKLKVPLEGTWEKLKHYE